MLIHDKKLKRLYVTLHLRHLRFEGKKLKVDDFLTVGFKVFLLKKTFKNTLEILPLCRVL